MADRYLYTKLREGNSPLADELDSVCREALKIWDEQSLRPFTAHGKLHIEQVEKNIDHLSHPLMESPISLSAEEIYVLLAACFLHDIGMQLDERDARPKHAQYAYDLILYSSAEVGTEARRITLPIHDTNARQAIALIARAHWTDYAMALQPEDYICGNQKGRLMLLGALLAMADLLDISPVRARYFRTIHHLYNLAPLSELHQNMHALVKGFQIVRPNSALKNVLQFQLDWHTNDATVHDISNWVMHWFDSQWRRLYPVLYERSSGLIDWAKPWARVIFNDPIGPLPKLSPHALNLLNAEIAEQRRIDRDIFVEEFKDALQHGKRTVFLFPKESDFDGRQVSTLCETYAKIREGCLVARADIQASIPQNVASIVSQLLEQLDGHLEQCSDDRAMEELHRLTSTTEKPIVIIIVTDRYRGHVLDLLLQVLLEGPDTEYAVARVCLLLSTGAVGPHELPNVDIKDFDGSIFDEEDVKKHLKQSWGYSEEEADKICGRISGIGIEGKPGKVCDYVTLHCGSSFY